MAFSFEKKKSIEVATRIKLGATYPGFANQPLEGNICTHTCGHAHTHITMYMPYICT